MRRDQFEHVVRAAADIVNDEIVVIGRQDVLAQYPDAPAALLQSMEVDVFPRNEPERAEEIDAAIGDGSRFQATYDRQPRSSHTSACGSRSARPTRCPSQRRRRARWWRGSPNTRSKRQACFASRPELTKRRASPLCQTGASKRAEPRPGECAKLAGKLECEPEPSRDG